MTARMYIGDKVMFEQQQAACRAALEPSNDSSVDRWLIVGAGGFGREVYSWTLGQLHSNGSGVGIGFLDDNPDCFDRFPEFQHQWVDRLSAYEPQPGDRLLMAIADPIAKMAAARQLIERGALFATYVHPTAVLTAGCQIGVGSILCPMSVVCCNVRVGNFVAMNVGALVGHDSIVGDGCTLSPHANVAGQVELESGVFLGCQTVILPKVRVGEYARIGAGSSVISHVRAHSTMMGVPAKRISWTKSQDSCDHRAA